MDNQLIEEKIKKRIQWLYECKEKTNPLMKQGVDLQIQQYQSLLK